MKRNKKFLYWFFTLIFWFAIILVFALFDTSNLWNSWGAQEDGTFNYPGVGYLSLLLFKIVLYFFVPSIVTTLIWVFDERGDFLKRFLKTLNKWFLVVFVVKLLSDSFFELDRIFGLSLFRSINDIQTLTGIIITWFFTSVASNDEIESVTANSPYFLLRKEITERVLELVESTNFIDIATITSKDHNKDEFKNGLYFLYNESNEVVYVGKVGNGPTTSLYHRLIGHGSGAHKNAYWWKEVYKCKFYRFVGLDDKEILQIERLSIFGKSQPKYNDEPIRDEDMCKLKNKVN